MALSDLQKWLANLPGFRRHLTGVIIESVAGQFQGLVRQLPLDAVAPDWQYLLFSASILASSDIEEAQDAALRIAHHCLVSSNTGETEKDAAAIVLDALANRPAIHLAEQKALIVPGFAERIPFPLQRDVLRRALEYVVALSTGTSLFANKFQQRFWQMADTTEWLSVSAPTSAGKSYIVMRWLEEQIRLHAPIDIVYLVPSRALIIEIEEKLRQFFSDAVVRNVAVSSLPSTLMMRQGASNVFVFTQERLHLFMNKITESFRPQIVIVDEAHKIGDSHRGVLLQQVLDDVIDRNPAVKVLFASPLTSNPEVLLRDAPAGRRALPLISEQVTVNQNLIWVSQKTSGDAKQWRVDLRLDGESVPIGIVALRNSPSHVSKRLTYLAHALSHPDGGTVIYVNTAADAEKTATQLWDLLGEQSSVAHRTEVRDLIDLVRSTIHPQYSLIKVLDRGIGFHYGNMPLLVRKEIERLFREGVVRFLVCTSTLLEGVNLPCRSVFARGPCRGKTQPMSLGDFWNLAGRAGRWGQEFQGNVVCVDPKPGIWKNGVPDKRVKQKIEPTVDRIQGAITEIAAFVRSGTPREIASKHPELEYLTSYLATIRLKYGTLSTAPIANRLGPAATRRLEGAFAQGFLDLAIPNDVIVRNPGISPLAMQSLLRYFRGRKKPVHELIPAAPESDEATSVYIGIFNRINAHLANTFGRRERVTQCAILVVNWMRGHSLSRLIDSWVAYLKERKRTYNIHSEIRRTMEDVETIARYKAPKYLACYVDVLRIYLEEINQLSLLDDVPDLNMLLEFGVSQQTQMSLMALGLSRTATISVSEIIARDDMSIGETLDWLRTQDWNLIDLPALTKRDVLRAIQLAASN